MTGREARLKRWRSPFVFTLETRGETLLWKVGRSNGVAHQYLGTAERVRVGHGPPRWGKSWRWVPRAPSPSHNLFPPAATLRCAAEVLARHAGAFRASGAETDTP